MKKYLALSLIIILLNLAAFMTYKAFLVSEDDTVSISLNKLISIASEDILETHIFIGDTGTGESDQYRIAEVMKDYCLEKPCKSVVITGDVIYKEGVRSVNDIQFKTKFELPYANVDLPFYIALGNHDYYGCEDCYIEYAKTSQKFILPQKYYVISSFENLDIFIIDTQNFDGLQTKWLSEKLKQSEKEWKIVVGHKPIITSETLHAADSWSGRDSLLVTICTEADYYISGHSHSLEDMGQIDKCKVNQIISGAGSQEREVLDAQNISLNRFFYGDEGFISISITKDSALFFEFIDDHGNVIYTRLTRGLFKSTSNET